MRNRRFAVVALIVALPLGSLGSVATYEVLRSDADSPVPMMILQAQVCRRRCAADKRSDFLFDCMFFFAGLKIAEDGPAAFLEVA